jgi:predicted nucleic acid-binding protein
MNTNLLKQKYIDAVSSLIESIPELPRQLIHEKATEKAALYLWRKADGRLDWDDCLIECYCITGVLAEALGLWAE